MESFGHFLFDQVPWLRPVLAWLISGLLLLLLVCLPAYFVLLPWIKHLRQDVKEYTERLGARIKEARLEHEKSLDAQADALREQLSLRHISIAAGAHLDRLLRTIDRASARIVGTGERLPALTDAFQAQPNQQLSDSQFQIPPVTELQGPTGRLRVAWAKLTASTVVLLAVMTVNTGMLGEILKELGVVPATLQFGPIPFFAVMALLLTIVEAGLGLLHGATRPEPDEKERLAVWPVVAVLLAVTIAGVEGFFYSQVAPNKDALFELPLIGSSMKQQQILFFWGFVLVTAMFGLGSVWWSALETIRRGTALTEVAHRLGQLKRGIADRNRALTRVGAQTAKLSGALGELQGSFEGGSDPKSIQRWFAQVQDELKRLQREPPQWAEITERPLTRSDVEHLAQTAGVWMSLALVAAAAFSYLGADDIQQLYPSMRIVLAWCASIGAAVLFFVAGLLFFAAETMVRGTGTQRKLVVGSEWSRRIAIAIAVLLTAGYVVVIFRVGMPRYRAVLWVFHLLLGYMLFAGGYQLSPLVNVARLWIRRQCNMALAAAQIVYLLAVRAVHTVFALLEHIVFLFAAPIFAIRRNRSDDPAERVAKAAAQG